METLFKIPDFTSAHYLRSGTAVQRKIHGILMESAILDILAPYTPLVAGTIPIGIDIPGSDIDILCCAAQFDPIESLLAARFGGRDGFVCSRGSQNGLPVMVCNFDYGGMELEIFAGDKPVTLQNGYRHMITEYALLAAHGAWLREKVIALKLSGIKTEPAFATALGLEGDPYEAVLEKGRELGLF